MWTHRHLLGIEDLSASDIDTVLDRAEHWLAFSRRSEKKSGELRGRTIVNLFFEASTRTRTSFEIAGKRLGADVINVSSAGSSVSKGESLLDTAKNIEAMSTDLFVVRHASSGAAAFLASRLGAQVVNAGDGAHEHPTQALLDALTIRRAKGRLDGLTVAICGDISHSRVARSNALLLAKKGARLRLTGPKTMLPHAVERFGHDTSVHATLADAVRDVDVVMMLRIQKERFGDPLLSTTREYARTFGLDTKTLSLAKPDAIVLHPGPVNRGVELPPHIADGPTGRLLEQVEAGVAVRMAILELLLTTRGAS